MTNDQVNALMQMVKQVHEQQDIYMQVVMSEHYTVAYVFPVYVEENWDEEEDEENECD